MKHLALLLAAFALLGVGNVASVPCCDRDFHTLTCPPHVFCDLSLASGDSIDPQQKPVADETGWTVFAYADTKPVHVFFRASSLDSPKTLLTIPTVNGRSYHLWLEVRAQTDTIAYVVATPTPAPTSPPPPAVIVAPAPTPTPLVLTGVYHQTGLVPFQPARLGTDGTRTYVFFPHLLQYPVPIGVDGATHINFSVLVLADGGREYILGGVYDHFLLKLGDGRGAELLRIDRIPDTRSGGQR